MYKNYIFDLYGTLVDIRTDEKILELWEKMTEMYGFNGAMYTPDELKMCYRKFCKEENKKFDGKKYYEINIDYVFRALYEQKGVHPSTELIRFTGEMFRIISTKFIKHYEGVPEFFEELKQKNKKIYLLSNAQSTFTTPEIKYLGLWDYFDAVFISSEEEWKKPSENFFNRLIDKYNLNIKESIMIGNDASTDIAGAKAVGMDSLYIHTEISPENEDPEKVEATYKVVDGDFKKIPKLILK